MPRGVVERKVRYYRGDHLGLVSEYIGRCIKETKMRKPVWLMMYILRKPIYLTIT